MKEGGETTAEAVVGFAHPTHEEAAAAPVHALLPAPAAPPPSTSLRTEIEASLRAALQWTATQPNTATTWSRVRSVADDMLNAYFRAGTLKGATPAQAYFVRCDRTIMTQKDLDNGRLIVLVGIATLKPAEFVIIRIGLPAHKP